MKRDFLTLAFVVAALFCLIVSLPATLELTATTHNQLGAVLLLLVFELTAFGSKLSSLWVPSWSKTLDSLTKALLAVTALANAVAGWNHLGAAALDGAWLAVASFQLWSFPVGAVLLVALTALLVPIGQYLFLSLAIARQRELELGSSPEAVAARELEPVRVKLAELEQLQHFLGQLSPSSQLPQLSAPRELQLPAPQLVSSEAPSSVAPSSELIPCRRGCGASFKTAAAERAHQRQHKTA